MPFRRRRSVSRKLMRMNMLVSGAALLLACTAFIAYDLVTFRDNMVRNLAIQAQIIGSNSVSALTFSDRRSAETTLAALTAAPSVTAAGLYGPDGGLFATYRRSFGSEAALPASLPLAAQTHTGWFTDSGITMTRTIVFQGAPTGAVYIRSSLQDLQVRAQRYALIVGVVVFISLGAAWSVAWMAQRSISAPLAQLATVARHVSQDKDYAVRAAVSVDQDEVAVLIEAFNEMLVEIQRRDVSLQESRSQLEERVHARTAELASLNKELEAFSYSVSHDLRAPLRHVTGFVSLLENHAGRGLDDTGHRYLKTISTAAQRMGRLIDDLLAFSRTGRSAFVKKNVSLADLVRDVQSDVLSTTDSRDIVWTVQPLPCVAADPAMLRVVLVNLLSNAVKYTSTRPHARIEIGTLERNADETIVFVKDNGVGFDMRYVQKLFGVFQRLHGIDEFDGTGIGLATVRRIIERHGGRVWAEGEIDHGAAFYFALPRQDRPEVVPELPATVN